MQYLVDTSALIRIIRGQVDPAWERVVAEGRIAICEPVLRETMTVARKREYEALQDSLLEAYPWVDVPKPTWDYVRAMGGDLAKHSMHDMFSVADYLVAAVAIHLKLTVLHNDKDFVAAAAVFPQLEQKSVMETPDPA
ncbi:PIN domain-containing protein [Glycomyces paridis]|uniref:Ribonuclease VapC n=1 Tax=Glycomyces paridis TaxID=2126555 RepID=A0A4S8PNR3_9ACTN|nr:PIN domain-containing protein [Glycomyces paridis]THV31415.1 PIN domain nuclease [Glycomyces paridis]